MNYVIMWIIFPFLIFVAFLANHPNWPPNKDSWQVIVDNHSTEEIFFCTGLLGSYTPIANAQNVVLVGGWATPLRNMFKSVGMIRNSIYGKIKKLSQPPIGSNRINIKLPLRLVDPWYFPCAMVDGLPCSSIKKEWGNPMAFPRLFLCLRHGQSQWKWIDGYTIPYHTIPYHTIL